jgi:hypothetical protein
MVCSTYSFVKVPLSFSMEVLRMVIPEKSIGQMRQSTLHGIEVSDILPRRYEGGYKLWECSIDLADYVVHCCTKASNSAESLIGSRICGGQVLEAGCGHGIPGIVALLCGADSVCLQDYNFEVLEDLTKYNVVANLTCDQRARVVLAGGDWSLFPSDVKYSCILTSETVYSTDAIDRLHGLFARVLVPRTGIAVVASKRIYFGLSGGVLEFEAVCAARGIFKTTRIATFGEGTVLRDIILVEFA